jgi:hypothetical protein
LSNDDDVSRHLFQYTTPCRNCQIFLNHG